MCVYLFGILVERRGEEEWEAKWEEGGEKGEG